MPRTYAFGVKKKPPATTLMMNSTMRASRPQTRSRILQCQTRIHGTTTLTNSTSWKIVCAIGEGGHPKDAFASCRSGEHLWQNRRAGSFREKIENVFSESYGGMVVNEIGLDGFTFIQGVVSIISSCCPLVIQVNGCTAGKSLRSMLVSNK